MWTFHLSSTLSEPGCAKWEKLARESLDASAHSQRKHSFLLARDALKKCLIDFGLTVATEQLVLENYHLLPNLPLLTISLSHTTTHGAALVAERKFYRSVGIDIEEKTRFVKESIRSRVSHPNDSKMSGIELWCAKEAVFKALMNTEEFIRPIEFSSIQIMPNKWLHSPSGHTGEWELREIGPILMALAFLKN